MLQLRKLKLGSKLTQDNTARVEIQALESFFSYFYTQEKEWMGNLETLRTTANGILF